MSKKSIDQLKYDFCSISKCDFDIKTERGSPNVK